MNIAIISDIHSNFEALETVMKEIDSLDIHTILCAGDIVGYYPFPNETVRLIRGKGARCIAGNHDRSALSGDTRWMNSVAASAIRWTHDHLDYETREFLSSLPNNAKLDIDGRRFALFHGSPMDDDEYVNEDEALPYMIQESGGEVLILGHTHVPFIRQFESGMILNPGSVGQPRDGDPRSSFAIFNTEDYTVEIRRIEYGVEKVARQTAEAGLPSVLGERLQFGI